MDELQGKHPKMVQPLMMRSLYSIGEKQNCFSQSLRLKG